jgi:hypothetical protein
MFGIVAGMMVYIVIAHLLPGKPFTRQSVFPEDHSIDACFASFAKREENPPCLCWTGAHRYDPNDEYATAACGFGMLAMSGSLMLFMA